MTPLGGELIHTPGFADRMADSDIVETRCVWDSSLDTARRRQDVAGGEIIDDPQIAFDDPEIEAVIIASQTARHRELVLPAVEAGKHVFVEKPLQMDGDQAEELASAINDAGILFQTGFFMRSDPNHLFARDVVQNEQLKQITRLRLSNAHSGALSDWFRDEWRWMADLDRAGVGEFCDLRAHVVDLLVWFMEDYEVDEATGHIDSAIEQYGGTDEYGEGMVTFEDGTVATIAAGWVDVASLRNIRVAITLRLIPQHVSLIYSLDEPVLVVILGAHFRHDDISSLDSAPGWHSDPALAPGLAKGSRAVR